MNLHIRKHVLTDVYNCIIQYIHICLYLYMIISSPTGSSKSRKSSSRWLQKTLHQFLYPIHSSNCLKALQTTHWRLILTSFVRGKVRKEHAIFTYLNYFVKKTRCQTCAKLSKSYHSQRLKRTNLLEDFEGNEIPSLKVAKWFQQNQS